MRMTFRVTPELERLIQNRLATGRYGSPNEVVRVALRLLEEHDQLHQAWASELRKRIDTGLDQLEKGEYSDGEQVFDELDRELDKQSGNRPPSG